jgi:predicted negative regulator of RcsB-dependent stress response
MPQTLIIIFLLFFAILAFGWFYWQRAKTRPTTTTTPTETAEPTDTTPTS